MAMRSPVAIITFSEVPRIDCTNAATTNDSAMATAPITVARQSLKKTARTSTRRTNPMSIAMPRLRIAASTKSVGRKIFESRSTPVRPGRISARASSTPCVTSRVLAPGNFSTTSIRLDLSLVTASPISG